MGFASAWVGVWLFAVWLSGSRWVYDDAFASGRSAAALDASWAVRSVPPGEPTEAAESSENVARIERVAGRDPGGEGLAPFEPRRPASYPLDTRSRAVTGSCPEVPLGDFAGNTIALIPGARVTPAFRERLLELEGIVSGVSQAFYGRSPSAMLVAASYDCRSVSGKNERLSEHALGNAIDITGFRFAAPAGAPAADDFEVRVDQHWKASGDAEQVRHARFLDALTQALLARDVFRTLLGPSHPDHADHFHFDMAPSHYVDL
jgi:hypothetical protein